MIYFTAIPDKFNYSFNKGAKLSSLHSDIISHAADDYDGTQKFKQHAIDVINKTTYWYLSGDEFPLDWNYSNPLNNKIEITDAQIQFLKHKDMYINMSDVKWDLELPNIPTDFLENKVNIPEIPEPDDGNIEDNLIKLSDIRKNIGIANSFRINPYIDKEEDDKEPSMLFEDMMGLTGEEWSNKTPKEDLYIQPPTIPRFDSKHPVFSQYADGNLYVIYPSLPLIPTRQNEISATTEIDKMSDSDLLKLFPRQMIRTRSSCMYEPIDGIDFDPILGLILPIKGYTKKQLLHNVIQYPHFYQLKRLIDDKLENFYSSIEIDGELHKIMEICSELPEFEVIPKTPEFMKEYVTRRYLLERDVKHIEHKYPLFGTLDKFLTLFTTLGDYANYGYTNSLALAKDCVKARVAYKRSRNPILRKFGIA